METQSNFFRSDPTPPPAVSAEAAAAMSTALVRVTAPESIAEKLAPVGFTPLRDLGAGQLAISGSGLVLSVGLNTTNYIVCSSSH